MPKKYTSLEELMYARKAGEVPLTNKDENTGDEWPIVLWLDNDTVDMYVDGKNVFSADPQQLLLEALDLLDIPAESV